MNYGGHFICNICYVKHKQCKLNNCFEDFKYLRKYMGFSKKYLKKFNEEIERHNLLTRLHNIEKKLNQLEEDFKYLINIYKEKNFKEY
jgi:transposase-like protein